jgi:Lysozyme like domain/Ricin-type beta-trefoil lectin domain
MRSSVNRALPAGEPGPRGLAARAARRLTLLSAISMLLAVAGPLAQSGAASASAGPPPAAGQVKPASLGPGLGRPAAADTVSEAYVCAKVAAKAGFSYTTRVHANNGGSYPQIVVAVAIGLAESSCNPSATYTNPDGCVDRGLWQIDSCAWPNVSNACAYQIQCNAAAAWNISAKGTYWCPWSTYSPRGPSDCGTPGPYTSYLGLAEQSVHGFAFQIEDHGAGTCLAAASAAKVYQWSCSQSNTAEQWYVAGSLGHNPVLKNARTGTCLKLDGAKIGNGGPVFLRACNTGDAFQRWWWRGSGELNTNGNADAGLHVDGTSKTCLDADGRGNGAGIYQWTCNQSHPYQQWN